MTSRIIKSDNDIKSLITCRKVFKTAPRKESAVNQNMSQKFNVYSEDHSLEFLVFISYSRRMEQDFSIGLMYDNMLLYRCNGFHGTTRAGFYSAKHHAYPHAHVLSVSDINCGRSRDPSTIEDLTGQYINLKTATLHFFDKCGIIGYESYFNLNQVSFDDFASREEETL